MFILEQNKINEFLGFRIIKRTDGIEISNKNRHSVIKENNYIRMNITFQNTNELIAYKKLIDFVIVEQFMLNNQELYDYNRVCDTISLNSNDIVSLDNIYEYPEIKFCYVGIALLLKGWQFDKYNMFKDDVVKSLKWSAKEIIEIFATEYEISEELAEFIYFNNKKNTKEVLEPIFNVIKNEFQRE